MSKNSKKARNKQYTPPAASNEENGSSSEAPAAPLGAAQEEVAAGPSPAPAEVENPQAPEDPIDHDEDARWAAIKERRDAVKQTRASMGAIGDQKLFAPTRPGFYRRWINDDGNRLAEMKNKGYDFVRKGAPYSEGVVSTGDGSEISQLVGKTKTNNPMRAFLMEIPQEWVDEDRSEKEQKRAAVEESVHRAAHGDKSLAQTGRSVMYDPTKGNSHFETQ